MTFISFLLILVIAILFGAVSFVGILWRGRFQFSLRALLIGVTLVAIVLSGIQAWRHWSTARTTWLDPTSEEARAFLCEAAIVESGGGFEATFRPNFRSFGQLMGILTKTAIPTGSGMNSRFDHESQKMSFLARERKPLEDRLALLKSSDVLQPGWFVIRGRVENSAGEPVGGAIVDLIGEYVYINHFKTRADGTFLMPIQAPAGNFYALRIRYNDDKQEMSTEGFFLDPASPEKVVRIQVK